MTQTLNNKTVTLKLRRIDVCDLKLACTNIMIATGNKESGKWKELHDKLQVVLDEFDKKQGY